MQPSKRSFWFLGMMSVSMLVFSPGCSNDELDDEVLCGEGIVGDLHQAPSVNITELDDQATWIAGTVKNVDATQHRIVAYVQTDVWYVQPLTANPFTLICNNGTWGTSSHPGDRAAVLVVDNMFVPEYQIFAHPSTQSGVLASDEAIPPGTKLRQLDWSGYSWDTKRYSPYGPGPNNWSDDPSHVWVDSDGLHLTIQKVQGSWVCTEVWINTSLGYGSYEFRISSRLNDFQPEIVFGMFVYASDEEEIDIEIGKLEKQGSENAQFVVQPYYHLNNRLDFVMDGSETSTHRFEWRPDSIKFVSWRGHGSYPPAPNSVIAQWDYSGPDIPVPGKENPRINLWLYQGAPPSDGLPVEVVLSSFTFTP